ncbi:MAG: winged helix-turn-helix transcriptional regulator [Clostridia bacterium]|nr:winged helix-turn-helix transcriptional regulator [Clostridia bacterium]
MNRSTKQLRAAEVKKAVGAAKVFKALSDESRVKIVLMLSSGATNACDFMDELNISQPTLSHHLKILSEAGIVQMQKEGKWRIYSLSESGTRAAAYIING